MTIRFLDCEASSLDADSWLVEVGLSWLTEGRVEVRPPSETNQA